MKLVRLTLVASFLGFAACADLTGPDTPAMSADEASRVDAGSSSLPPGTDDGQRTQLGSGGRSSGDDDGEDE
jgi:hypothetical protein